MQIFLNTNNYKVYILKDLTKYIYIFLVKYVTNSQMNRSTVIIIVTVFTK